MKEQASILHISTSNRWGGGENHILNLCQELTTVRHLVLCRKRSDLYERLELEGIHPYNAPLVTKFDLRFVWKLIRLCKKNKVDIIHIHDTTALTLAIMATYLSGNLPPYVLSKKTSFPIKNRKRTLYKYNHRQIKKILCVSNVTRQITSEKVVDSSKLSTVYHGTKVPKKNSNPAILRESYNIPKEVYLIGTIANHIRAKNLETWINTVDHIVNDLGLTNFYFIVIGNKTERTAGYLKKITERNIEAYCHFTGYIPHAWAMIPQFDLALLTSQSEGIPQFLYECFYYKVPVVSTNVGGIPEIIEDDGNGFLCPPHDAVSLGNKLVLLSQDRSRQLQFSEISHQRLVKNFTTKQMAANTLGQYNEVLYGKNRSGS